MNVQEEMFRRLLAVMHVGLVLLAVPYLLLAIFFLVIGHAASQQGLWGAFEAFLNALNWLVTWGIFLLAILFVSIGLMGFFESAKWWGSLSLAALMVITMSILILYRPQWPEPGEWLFFAPGFFILAVCCWRIFSK